MTEHELAWAAGFFDGEGCIIRDGKGYLRLSVCQKDRRPLDRFVLAVGMGNVTGPYPLFWVQVTGEKVRTLIELLWPYMSEPKKEQAQIALL